MATFATFIGIPVSAALGAASMTGANASGIILVLTKMYQQKLKKVTCLIDIVTPALVLFERVVSSLFSSLRFPKRERSGLLNNLQNLVQSIMIT